MTRKFTKLIAALALLVFMTPSMAGWGQVSSVAPVDGNSYVVAAYVNNKYYALPNGTVNGNTITGVEITLNSLNKVSTSVAAGKTWTLESGTYNNTSGFRFKYTNGNKTYYLYKNGTGTGNYNFAVGETNKTLWSFTTNGTGYTVTAIDRGTTNNILIQCNNGIFRCYSTATPIILLEIGDAPTAYSVTYKANGGTGDNLVDGGYVSGATVTVKANEGTGNPNFTRTGYTFNKWNTKADGTGTDYSAGNTFNISGNTDLFAQWTKNNYNVAISSINGVTLTATYGANTITEGNSANVPYATAVTLVASELGTGQVFVWNITKTDGGEDVTASVLSGIILTVPDYGITIGGTVVQTYTVTYKANGPANLNDIVDTFNENESATIRPANTFSFSQHAFTGWNTEANGLGTGYAPGDAIENISANYTLYAQWESSMIDVLNRALTGVASGGGYSDWSGKTCTNGSNAVYAGNSAGGNSSIQLRSSDGSGIISTTSGGKVRKVEVVWNNSTANNRVLSVYGKNTPYTATSDLYDADKQGTLLGEILYNSNNVTTTELNVTGTYLYIGLRSKSGAMYLSEIDINWTEVTEPFMAVNSNSVDIDKDGEAMAVPVTYYNIEDMSSVSIELLESNGTTPATYDWFNPAFDPEDYKVVQQIGENVGPARKAYFKVKYAPTGEEPVYSELVTVTQAAATYDLNVSFVNADVDEFHLFDGNENEIVYNEVTHKATVEAGVEVHASIQITDSVALRSVLVTFGNEQSVPVTEITPYVYYSFTMPSNEANLSITTEAATPYTLSIVKPTEVNFSNLLVGWDGDIVDPSGNQASICEQATVVVNELSVTGGKFLESVTLTYGEEGNETVEEVNESDGLYIINMPSSDATLTFVVRGASTYTLVESMSDLVPGKHYIIVGGRNISNVHHDFAMGKQEKNNRNAVEISIDNNTITEVSGVYEFVINGPEIIMKDDEPVEVYTIYDASVPGYLYAAGSGSNNYLKTQAPNNDNGKWTISIGSESVASIAAQGSNTNNTLQMNSNSNFFSCYGSSSQKDVYLYKKDNDANYEFYKDIAKDTWYFIASPVGTAPVNMGDLTDLYFYDEADHYWRNKEVAANADGFDFDFGKGYLAAYHVEGNSANGITLTFEGTSVCTDNTQTVAVSYNDNEDTNPLTGWNLVGNPYPHAAYLSQSFYTVAYDTENSKWVVQASTAGTVAACTGAMVKVDSGVTSVLFSKNAPSAPSNGSVKITMGQQVMNRDGVSSTTIDNAIVSFNEGNELPKFYFMEQNANLYIPQGEKEYAIATSEGQGEMPLNFRANADGQYTLTVNPEGVEMNYLHLIDNMTGNDIDLLQTPSYSFNAKTTDYESRFRLVFAANNESSVSASSTTFAFYSNGNWMVNNEGEATLQIIDVMGRVLSNQTISGTAELSLNQQPGVYVLRLVNGNDVKTQKIVVR